MKYFVKMLTTCFVFTTALHSLPAQQLPVQIIKAGKEKRIDILIGGKPFTSFLYPDSVEKPVLYPVFAANGSMVTRGFPLNPQAYEPTDHPHHIGIWLNFENVNGIDFWNNSYAIPKEKKPLYGWIKTDSILEVSNGTTAKLAYHANWVNQQNKVLLQETTNFTFSGTLNQRIITRQTILQADTTITFTDAKDGMLGMRLAHALQIPITKDQEFKDDKGNSTIVKAGADTIANGNYITSEGKQGDSAWSTRARWCKVYGKINNSTVTVVIMDHPANFNYPTFWHARGYGLFAANPLGEKVFTNGQTSKNLRLLKGNTITFRYRIIIEDGNTALSDSAINKLADEFANGN